jgi:hypothetical protein
MSAYELLFGNVIAGNVDAAWANDTIGNVAHECPLLAVAYALNGCMLGIGCVLSVAYALNGCMSVMGCMLSVAYALNGSTAALGCQPSSAGLPNLVVASASSFANLSEEEYNTSSSMSQSIGDLL